MWSIVVEYLPTIITACVSVITAFTSMLIYMINAKKKKSELQMKNLELEQEKIELQKAVLESSYVLCPNCQGKVYLKNAIVFTEKEALKSEK